MSTRSFSCSPANRPAPWHWTSSLAGQAARRRRSLCACDAAAQIPPSTLVRATANAAPSLPSDPMRAGDHAARGPRRHVEPIAPNGDGPPHRAIPRASAVRTARLHSRGHRRPVRPDTCMAPVAWTPRAWTPDVRLTDWTRTSAQRTEDADRATTGVAGVRTSSRPATTRWAARPRPGRSVWWRSASHNGSAVTTPAPRPWPPPLNNCPAPPSTPRLGALLSSDDFGSSVERTARLHPLWQVHRRVVGLRRIGAMRRRTRDAAQLA